MKTIILNGSPRKNRSTAELLHSAADGARSVGAEVEYIDLYDLNFTGCRSCLACKRKGAEKCKCYWKDELSPLIDRIFASDALIIGTPIYFGNITARVFELMERLCFCALSYNDYSNLFTGRVNAGFILTMNAGRSVYDDWYAKSMEAQLSPFRALRGEFEILPCCDTLQVDDYSKYDMAGFSEEHKRAVREKLFPHDLRAAFELGAELSAAKADR